MASMSLSIRSLTLAALALPLVLARGPARAEETHHEFGVYEHVLDKADGTAAETATALESAFSRGPWRVLARVEAGVPQDVLRGRGQVGLHEEHGHAGLDPRRAGLTDQVGPGASMIKPGTKRSGTP